DWRLSESLWCIQDPGQNQNMNERLTHRTPPRHVTTPACKRLHHWKSGVYDGFGNRARKSVLPQALMTLVPQGGRCVKNRIRPTSRVICLLKIVRCRSEAR